MNAILFSMWIECMKEIARDGKGNVMFFDGSTSGLAQTMKQIQAMNLVGQVPQETNPVNPAEVKKA